MWRGRDVAERVHAPADAEPMLRRRLGPAVFGVGMEWHGECMVIARRFLEPTLTST